MLACLLALSLQLLPPPVDGDIRVAYWELRNESEIWLTLEPRSAKGETAPMITFTHFFPGKSRTQPAASIIVRAFAGLFWAPRAEFTLLLDGAQRVDLTPPGGLTRGTPSDYAEGTISLDVLRQIARASRVTGNALGFEFELSPSQRKAIAAFIERVGGNR